MGAGVPGEERKGAAEGAAAENLVLTDAAAEGEGHGRDQLSRISYALLGELNKNKLKVSWSPTSVVGNKLIETLMLEPQAENEPQSQVQGTTEEAKTTEERSRSCSNFSGRQRLARRAR